MWQPIQSAPKNGEKILVLTLESNVLLVSYKKYKDMWTNKTNEVWMINYNREFNCPDSYINLNDAAFWMYPKDIVNLPKFGV